MIIDELRYYGTLCLICGEYIPIFDKHDVPKICDKCKSAIMKVRKEMECSEVVQNE